MIKILFLLPLLMFGIWYWYLRRNGWTIKQGRKGFSYIIIFNLVIAASLWIIMLLTQR